MEPILSSQIPNTEEWIHQIKWDGIRGLTYFNASVIKVITKNGNNHTDRYPEMMQVPKLFSGNEALLDGEMVVFDKNGKPSFSSILIRDRIRPDNKRNYYLSLYPVKYIVFDILLLNGKDLRQYRYKDRKELLNKLLGKNDSVTIADDFNDGIALYQLMADKNLEGIVSKRVDSVYKEGKKHEDWFKVKLNKKILAAVGGVSLKNSFPNALLLGIFRNNQLEYIGKAATGLKTSDYEILKQYISVLKSKECPFVNMKDKGEYIWFEPKMTCWIKFMDWTSTGGLRHPVIIGFSSDAIEKADGTEWVIR